MPRATTNTNNRALAYVRVSDTRDRAGASYISPDVQRDTINRLADAAGLEVVDEVTEENVSGNQAADERRLGEAVARIESGDVGTLIVWEVSRFSRNLIDGLTTAKRVTDAGGRLLAGDIDTARQDVFLSLPIMLAMAQRQRDGLRAAWHEGRQRAINRAAWPRPDVPVGYVTEPVDPADADAGRRLVPDPDLVPHVRWAFEARARRASWNDLRVELARRALVLSAEAHAEAQAARDAGDDERAAAALERVPRVRRLNMSRNAIRTMIRSKTYLGIIEEDGYDPNPNAHEAIIDIDTWRRADWKGVAAARSGAAGKYGILKDIARCAACGGPVGVSGKGSSLSYRCRDQRTTRCPGRVSITIAQVDPHVLPMIQERLAHVRDEATEQADIDRASKATERAERALREFVEHVDIADMGGELYAQQLRRLRDDIAAAHAEGEALQTRLAASLFARIGRTQDLADADIDAQRAAAVATIDHVILRRRNGDAPRFDVVWRDV